MQARIIIAIMTSSIKLCCVKTILAILIGLFLAFAAKAQDPLPQPDEIIQSVQEWIEDNLDEKALDELGVDKDRVQQFLTEVRRRFQGTYVYDLGALRETATSVLPVLQQFEETRPLAVWLQTVLITSMSPSNCAAKPNPRRRNRPCRVCRIRRRKSNARSGSES